MYIYGTGGHAKVINDCLESNAQVIDGFIEDYKTIDTFLGKKVVRGLPPGREVILAIGNNKIRQHLDLKLRATYGVSVHPSAILSPYSSIGPGCMMIHYAVVQSHVAIGKHVIINTHADVEHDCEIHDYVHIGPRSTLCEGVIVEEGALVGAGATVLPGIRIGAWSIVGAGSVVTREVKPGSTVFGNPAKPQPYSMASQQ